MAFEHRDNSGSAFINKFKNKDTQPDLTGDGLIEGTPYRISVWKKKDKNGGTFISLSFTKKIEQPPAEAPSPVSDDDEIPF
jgi:hypothetical protein